MRILKEKMSVWNPERKEQEILLHNGYGGSRL